MTTAQLYDVGCPLWCTAYSIEQLSYYFTNAFELPTGASVINFMETYVIPNIILQNISANAGVLGNIHTTSGYPSMVMSHHMVTPDKPRKKGTVQVPSSGPFQ